MARGCLLVLAHPAPGSLNHALADHAATILRKAGRDVTLLDLYATGFDPGLSEAERRSYHAAHYASEGIAEHAKALRQAEILVFVFPTWWFGLPAILKGFVDRVFAPGIAFNHAADFGPIKPALTHLRQVFVITTLGSPWWIDRFVMRRPVRRIIKTGLIGPCAPQARTHYLPFYGAEDVSKARVDRHFDRIAKALDRATARQR